MSALSDHSIKAARYATKYQLIGRLVGGYLGKLISGPTDPNAGARSIAPHDAPGLRFRHTAVDACLVAVGAFYQTRTHCRGNGRTGHSPASLGSPVCFIECLFLDFGYAQAITLLVAQAGERPNALEGIPHLMSVAGPS
jgi:hypothetical protein